MSGRTDIKGTAQDGAHQHTFDAQLPPTAHLTPRQDRSRTIRAAFKNIQVTMLVTLLLVFGVIFLFLHNGPAMLIPPLAPPFSILATFAVMQALHFPLTPLSITPLTPPLA